MKRRDFIKLSAAAAGAAVIPARLVHAEDEKPMLATDDPQAEALEYTESSEVDGERCNNCIHATGDLSADAFGCNLFPNNRVAAEGWCNVWAER